MVIAIITVHMNPICVVISALFAVFYARNAKLLLVIPLTAAINAMFNHRGATILFFLPSGNHVTAESLIYGFAAGTMVVAIVSWFKYVNKILTTDKIIYLFGRFSPKLALVFSMTLRFSERFSAQYQRFKPVLGRKAFGVTVTNMLENGVDTADSMRFRGFGRKKRSSFAIFRFDMRDFAVLAAVIAFGTVLWLKMPVYAYFPTLNAPFTVYYIFFAGFCALGVFAWI